MHRRLLIFATAILASLCTFGQAEIGFTNLNGFPSVIVNGNSYNLSGYIVNTGQDTLFSNIDIKMSVNSGPTIPIENNVSLGAIAPGDSVLWTKNGHGFPGGQFAPGNNDVLIWPTRVAGPGPSVESVTQETDMFYVDNQSAAFRIPGNVNGFTNAIPLREAINLEVTAENIGAVANQGEVGLFMSYNGGSPLLLTATGATLDVGDQHMYSVPGFVLYDYLPYLGAEIENGMAGEIAFSVREIDGLEAVNKKAYPISNVIATSVDVSLDAVDMIYPNPASEVLRISYADQATYSIHAVEVYSLDGRKIRSFDHAVSAILLDKLASGQYLLRIVTEEGATSVPFIKE